jgi:hypothetical protein
MLSLIYLFAFALSNCIPHRLAEKYGDEDSTVTKSSVFMSKTYRTNIQNKKPPMTRRMKMILKIFFVMNHPTQRPTHPQAIMPGRRQSVRFVKYPQRIQQSVTHTNKPKKLKTGFTLFIDIRIIYFLFIQSSR